MINCIAEDNISRAKSEFSITLIVLAYNHASYLPQLFSSINKNISNINELICIENGSTDNSLVMMKEFLDSLKGEILTHLFINPPRTGVAKAVNAALNAATSEYIAVISGDDYLLPNRFTRQLDLMRENKTLEFCYGNGYVCNEDGLLSSIPIHNNLTIKLLTEDPKSILSRLYYPTPTLFTQCALFRRNALLDVGGWDEDLIIEDWPLNIKLFAKFNERFCFENNFVVAYRRHPENASRRRFRQYFGQKQIIEKYARGIYLKRALFSLFLSQMFSYLKKGQHLRALIFLRSSLKCRVGFTFAIYWIFNEIQRQIKRKKIF